MPLLSELRRLGEAAVGAMQPGGGLDGLEEKVGAQGNGNAVGNTALNGA